MTDEKTGKNRTNTMTGKCEEYLRIAVEELYMLGKESHTVKEIIGAVDIQKENPNNHNMYGTESVILPLINFTSATIRQTHSKLVKQGLIHKIKGKNVYTMPKHLNRAVQLAEKPMPLTSWPYEKVEKEVEKVVVREVVLDDEDALEWDQGAVCPYQIHVWDEGNGTTTIKVEKKDVPCACPPSEQYLEELLAMCRAFTGGNATLLQLNQTVDRVYGEVFGNE
jgi:hypothetical protein